jgi:hypothetical protein
MSRESDNHILKTLLHILGTGPQTGTQQTRKARQNGPQAHHAACYQAAWAKYMTELRLLKAGPAGNRLSHGGDSPLFQTAVSMKAANIRHSTDLSWQRKPGRALRRRRIAVHLQKCAEQGLKSGRNDENPKVQTFPKP